MTKITHLQDQPSRRRPRILPAERPETIDGFVELFRAHNPDLVPQSWADIRDAHPTFFTKYLKGDPRRAAVQGALAAHYGVDHVPHAREKLVWSDCATPQTLADRIVDTITEAGLSGPGSMMESNHGRNIAAQIARATRRGETVCGEPIRSAIHARLGWPAARNWVRPAFIEADLDDYPDDPNEILEVLSAEAEPYRSVPQWRAGDIRSYRAAQALSARHGVDFFAEVSKQNGFRQRRDWSDLPPVILRARLLHSAAPHDSQPAWRRADPYAHRLSTETRDPDQPERRLIELIAEQMDWDTVDSYRRESPEARVRLVRDAAAACSSLPEFRETLWYKRALRLGLVPELVRENGWHVHRHWPTDPDRLKAALLERAAGCDSCSAFEAADLAGYAKACRSGLIDWLSGEMGWPGVRLWSKDPATLRRQLDTAADAAAASGVDSFAGWLAHDCGAAEVARRAGLHRGICADRGWRINRERNEYPKDDEAAFDMLLRIFRSHDTWADLLAEDFPAVYQARSRGMIDRLRKAMDWPAVLYSERDRLYIWFDRRRDRNERPGRWLVKTGTQCSAARFSSLGERIDTVARQHEVTTPHPLLMWQFEEAGPAFEIETALLNALSAPEQLYHGEGDGYRELRWLTEAEIVDLLRDAWRLCTDAGGWPLSKADLRREKARAA